MDCHSSDDGAFNTQIRGEEKERYFNISAPSTSTKNESIKDDGRREEVVFGTSSPRGPLAGLMKRSNGSSSVETSLDMIKISLKDSSGEYTTSSLNEDRYESKDQPANNKTTTTTVICSEDTKPKSSTDFPQHADNDMVWNIKLKYDNTEALSDDETTSMDRTIVDSELPSLPIDKLGNLDNGDTAGKRGNDVKIHNDEDHKDLMNESATSSEQRNLEMDAGPISLSDIKLEEYLQ